MCLSQRLSPRVCASLLTLSELAVVAGVCTIFVGFFICKEPTVKSPGLTSKETATITVIIFAIIATGIFLRVVTTFNQIPQKILNYFRNMGENFTLNWVALAIICLLLGAFLLLGTFVEIVPVFYFTVLILAVITISFERSLLHLYVVFVAFAGIGRITPLV